MRKSRYPLLLVSAVWLLALFACPGRQPARKGPAPSPPEIAVNSYTALLDGYRQTVTVKASEEELYDFLSRPNNLVFRAVEFGEVVPALGQAEPGPGTSYLYDFNFVVTVPGRMIAIKLDRANVWHVKNDAPHFNVQQWELGPVPDGTRLTLKTMNEIRDKLWVKAAGIIITPEVWHGTNDMMLAELQAHFDPSEDPEKLVSMGLRGEGYRSVLQVNETSILIEAPAKAVERALDDPKVLSSLLGEDREGRLARTLPKDRVLYWVAVVDHEGQPLEIENFGINHGQGLERRRRYYQVALGLVGQLELVFKPEGLGTRLTAEWKWEMPDSMETGSMEQAIFIAGAPGRLREAVSRIKQEAESGP